MLASRRPNRRAAPCWTMVDSRVTFPLAARPRLLSEMRAVRPTLGLDDVHPWNSERHGPVEASRSVMTTGPQDRDAQVVAFDIA